MPFWSTNVVSVIVVAGQSNAVGYPHSISDVPAHLQTIDQLTKIWTSGSTFAPLNNGTNNYIQGGQEWWGPEAEFAYQWRLTYPAVPLFIVKYAVNATYLASLSSGFGPDWNPGNTGELFDAEAAYITAALAYLTARSLVPKVRAVLWDQGQSDCLDPTYAGLYETNLSAFFTKVRTNWGDSNTKILVNRVNNQTVLSANRVLVRAAQVSVVAADTLGKSAWIDTDAYELEPDHLHLTFNGQVSSGQGFFIAYQPLAGA